MQCNTGLFSIGIQAATSTQDVTQQSTVHAMCCQLRETSLSGKFSVKPHFVPWRADTSLCVGTFHL